ncbi:MAG: hypothetical protein OQJ99_02020, partial [Rhodospirillales bacterium]|nr:hypothetical protein [Rhodospirillales bacterium]
IHRSEPLLMASVTTVRPIARPATVAKSKRRSPYFSFHSNLFNFGCAVQDNPSLPSGQSRQKTAEQPDHQRAWRQEQTDVLEAE